MAAIRSQACLAVRILRHQIEKGSVFTLNLMCFSVSVPCRLYNVESTWTQKVGEMKDRQFQYKNHLGDDLINLLKHSIHRR